jgi:hypothetical protein
VQIRFHASSPWLASRKCGASDSSPQTESAGPNALPFIHPKL